jgi:hypothetical protein
MPNPVQAAAEGLPILTRRKALGLLAAASIPPTAAVAVAAAQPIEEAFDLQRWLDTAEPTAVIRYHAARLAEAMAAADPTRTYRDQVDYKRGFALIVGDPIDGRRSPVAKVRVDDGSPLFADDVTGTTAFADWERARA